MRAAFFRSLVAAFFACSSLVGLAQQDWPSKPIRLVVPYTPAGGTDILGRLIAQRLSDALGVPVIADNKPGADGAIGTDIVAKAAPDGYTLLIDGTSQAYNVAFGKKLPYDPVRDLVPVVQTATQPVLLLVNAGLPVHTVGELVAYAKAHPGKLSYGASSNANVLPMELFKHLTGTDIVHVPYKGSGPMLNDLLGGQIDLAMSGAAAPLPHVKAGKLRVLGLGEASPSLPDYPTVASAGVPTFQTVQWSGIYAPAGTPAAIVTRLNREVARILQEPALQKRMVEVGFDPVSGDNTPRQWAALVADEVDKWSGIVRTVGLKRD